MKNTPFSVTSVVALSIVAVALYALPVIPLHSASLPYPDKTLAVSANTYTKPSKAVLKKKLTALQFDVTQNEATERPFENAYWDNTKPGIYVDIVSGEPLFSSTDKFKSGTGWPSFTRPIQGTELVLKKDNRLFYTRVELRSKLADSHLGHLFNDGPKPTGKRYCINSASLRFIPEGDLKKEGYEQYATLFSAAH